MAASGAEKTSGKWKSGLSCASAPFGKQLGFKPALINLGPAFRGTQWQLKILS